MNQLTIVRSEALMVLGFTDFDKMVFLPRLGDARDYITFLEHCPSRLGNTIDSMAWAFVLSPEESPYYPIEFISLTLNRKLPASMAAQFSIEKHWRNQLKDCLMTSLLSRKEMLNAIFQDEVLIAESYQTTHRESHRHVGLEIAENGLVTKISPRM
jgi:hypothetical protein